MKTTRIGIESPCEDRRIYNSASNCHVHYIWSTRDRGHATANPRTISKHVQTKIFADEGFVYVERNKDVKLRGGWDTGGAMQDTKTSATLHGESAWLQRTLLGVTNPPSYVRDGHGSVPLRLRPPSFQRPHRR